MSSLCDCVLLFFVLCFDGVYSILAHPTGKSPLPSTRLSCFHVLFGCGVLTFISCLSELGWWVVTKTWEPSQGPCL